MRARWFTGRQVDPTFIKQHFVPLALDSYFPGNQEESKFFRQVNAGGNRLVVATATGKTLAAGRDLRLRQRELAAALAKFRRLPLSERKPEIKAGDSKLTAKGAFPEPPEGGLSLRGYCSYMRISGGKPTRNDVYYYRRNPNAWKAETQSDMLWLTKEERNNLLSTDLRIGQSIEVSQAVRERLFGTIGIDYMEGGVNALPVLESALQFIVETEDEQGFTLRVQGQGRMGKPWAEKIKREPHSRGCEIQIVGTVHCDKSLEIDRFDVIGLGRAWGNKMKSVQRELEIGNDVWMYGIAIELVTGNDPIDRIPPYNLLHLNGQGYYAK